MRWLQQEKTAIALSPTLSVGEGAPESRCELVVTGMVIRENLVRLTNIPLVFKAHSMPEQLPHTKVTLGLGDIDLLDLNLHTRFIAAEAPVATPTTEEAAC